MKQAKPPFSTNVNICDEKQIVTFSSLQNVIKNFGQSHLLDNYTIKLVEFETNYKQFMTF